MNYSTLFPEMLKDLPSINNKDICYHYQKNNNDNKNNIKLVIPQGKPMLLWFLKYNKEKYSILLEYNRHKNNIQKCYFQYLSFKPELTNKCGTIILCTKIKNELCLQKIIYFMGKRYDNANISYHLRDLKYMLENYIHQLYHNEFVKLRLPFMINNKYQLFKVSNLPYNVHSIMGMNQYQIFIKQFCANFIIEPSDIKKDIYMLFIGNDKTYYTNAFVNDIKTSQLLKESFLRKPISYNEIEYSDDESENNEEILKSTQMNYQCIYIPHLKRWKPYNITSKPLSSLYEIKKVENMNYENYL